MHSESSDVTSGGLRQMLVQCIQEVRGGKMSHQEAKSVAMLAGQVNLSLQVELNVRREETEMAAKSKFGDLSVAGGVLSFVSDAPSAPDPSLIARSPWPSVRRHECKDE